MIRDVNIADFTEPTGAQQLNNQNPQKEKDFLDEMIPETVWDRIARETNR